MDPLARSGALCCALWLALALTGSIELPSLPALRSNVSASQVEERRAEGAGFLRPRAGFLARFRLGAAPATPSGAWREARLREARELDAARISAYARRYGIGPRLSREIYEAARAEQVHPALAYGLVQTESGFDARAVGPRGSIGLTQLQPATARELSPSVSAGDLYTPRVNLSLGLRYLRRLLIRFDNDVTLALVAYNRGPSAVERLLERGRQPGTAYARKVLRNVEPGSLAAL